MLGVGERPDGHRLERRCADVGWLGHRVGRLHEHVQRQRLDDRRPDGRSLTVTVTGSTVTPAPSQHDLGVGETLTLVVTSDHDDQLHAHGFEVEKDLKAGVPTTITLTGKDAGVFEVETHHPALTLLTIAVR